MANYNFLNLDSNEFEQVCAEILSIYLGKSFRTYAPGPDGGVDIKQTNGSNSIIGQAKRYKNPSDLPIEKEYNKLKNIKDCKKYYFFTSCFLSQNKTTEIYTTFKDYMDDESFIFDATVLNNLLETDEYISVLKNHFRLWATSERIMKLLIPNDVDIDTDVFKDNIKEHLKYYVETGEYFKALKVFEEERIILLKGSAGIGKTTTSEMLVLNFLNKHPNARFIYSSSGNVESLKKSLSPNPEVIELVLIDDFLGDIYLNLRGDRINSIVSFISRFKNSKNKYLIINSRIVILEEAQNNFIGFSKSLDSIGVKQIDLSGLSKRDRAMILYNHIYFSDISREDKQSFLEKKLYVKITEHQNYNPRLIEDICNNKRFSMSGMSFEQYAISTLNNQERTWHHAFDNNLDKADRILLLVLFSFGSQFIRVDSLEKAFLYEARKHGDIDLSKNVFGLSLKRLSGAFIKITVYSGGRFVSFLNPSVKDCVASNIQLFDSNGEFLFFDQYLGVYGVDSFVASKEFDNMVRNNRIGDLFLEHYSRCEPYIMYFAKNLVLDKSLEDYYLDAISADLSSSYSKIADYYSIGLFRSLVAEEYIGFYDLSKLDENQLSIFVINCISNISVEEMIRVFAKVNQTLLFDILQTDEIKEAVVNSIYNGYDKSSAISSAIYEDEYDGHPIFDEDRAKEVAVDEIDSEIYSTYHSLFELFDFSIDAEYIDACIASDDFKKEFESEHRDYNHEDYYPDFANSEDCYDIFDSLLR